MVDRPLTGAEIAGPWEQENGMAEAPLCFGILDFSLEP